MTARDMADLTDEEITTLTIRMPRALRERIKELARLEDRNESQVIRYYLTRALDARVSGNDDSGARAEQP